MSKKYDIILEDTIDNEYLGIHENAGIISNGERFLFFRVDENNVCKVYFHLSDFLSGIENFVFDRTAKNNEALLAILNDEQEDIEAHRKFCRERGEEVNPKDEAWFLPRIFKRASTLNARKDLLTQEAFDSFCCRIAAAGINDKEIVKATLTLINLFNDKYVVIEPTIRDEYRKLIVPDNLLVLTRDEENPEAVCVCEDNDGCLEISKYDGTETGSDAPNCKYYFYLAWLMNFKEFYMGLNEEKLPAALKTIIADISESLDGKAYVKAINAYLREKGTNSVWFDPRTYDDIEDIPVCVETGTRITNVSLPEDGSKDKIILTVIDPANPEKEIENVFTGREEENFEEIFFEVYYYINDADSPEAEEWLKENGFEE